MAGYTDTTPTPAPNLAPVAPAASVDAPLLAPVAEFQQTDARVVALGAGVPILKPGSASGRSRTLKGGRSSTAST
jgi:hypothetical protein